LGFILNNFFKKIIINFFIKIIFIILFIILYFYINYIYLLNPNTYNILHYTSKINFLGYSLFVTGILVGFFIFFFSDSRIFYKNNFTIFYFFLFFILIWFFINETNYINLFFLYELFLLPSFYLVYTISPNRRSIPVSIYFLTWTQFGSIFILIGVIYLYLLTGSFLLTPNNNFNYNVVFFLFFIGFGIKIPLWPFYYWLTKTHVEASSFFSIYLSGFLVKTAVYLFNFFYSLYFNSFFFDFIFCIILIGIIDSSIKMWHQFDFKKLVAYTTVQEMNFLFLPILWNNELSEIITSIFIIVHCLLSTLFFFITDILIKRFNTRIVTQITGLIHTMPTFSCFFFLSLIFFLGLPFTSKFFIEIFIFNLIITKQLKFFIFLLLVMNWFAVIGFSKNVFNMLFGQTISKKIVYDLNKKEIFLFIFILFLLLIVTFLTNSFF